MSKDKDKVVDLRDKKPEKKSKQVIGLDIGTANIVAAVYNTGTKETTISSMKNMFLTIENDVYADLSSIDHIKGEEGRSYIFGTHALQFANIFGGEPRRPMAKGLISTKEVDAIDILAMLIKNLIGQGNGKDDECVFSIPAQSLDNDVSTIYHENVFKRILKQLGYKSTSLNQALASVYSQCESDKFSGIVCDFGAGQSNVVLAYRKNAALSFSVSRGGDWIDHETAKSLGITASGRVMVLKETNLDLSNPMHGNKKERRVREALIFYYENLIRYTLKLIKKEFDKISETISIPEELPIIVSGGTSKCKGFLELFREVFESIEDFPVNIKEIRHSDDPLTSVAEGALIKGLAKK